MRPRYLTIPNILTLIRMAAIPFVLILLSWDHGSPDDNVLTTFSYGRVATIILLACGVLDMLDGWIARRYNQVSKIGKLMDPMTDKILIMSVLVLLVHMGRAPWWLTVLILGREMAASTLRGLAAGDGIIIEALRLGKFKQTTLMIGVGGLMVNGFFVFAQASPAGMVLLYIGTVSAYLSLFEYLFKYIRVLTEEAA